MGFIKHLLGIRGVGRVTTSFREDGNHRVTVERDSATSPSLDAAALTAILFLYYAAKALHAVGSGPDADELRQDIALCALASSTLGRRSVLQYRFNWRHLYAMLIGDAHVSTEAQDTVTVQCSGHMTVRSLLVALGWPGALAGSAPNCR